MPIHLPQIGRREFLKGVSAGAAGLLLPLGGCDERAEGEAAQNATPKTHQLALLSDTHIPDDAKLGVREVVMADNLRRVVAELNALPERPAGVLINGDCAYLKGLEGDYRLLGELIQPLREHYPLHLTMGNHDDREQFFSVLRDAAPANPPVMDRHVSVLKMPGANWFLLDSLKEVNKVAGELGEAQLAWLAAALDEHADQPAIIVLHHNPQWEPREEPPRVTGLIDTATMWNLLVPRKQVKAVVFGHTHDWKLRQDEGIHLINLPPVAYVFNKERPSGWVHATVREGGMDLRLHALDAGHAEHGKTATLQWRG